MEISLKTMGLALINFMFTTPAMAIPMEQHVQKVASHLTGVMVRSQPSGNPETAQVRMVTCRVNVPQSNQTFLYQEQALVKQPQQPYLGLTQPEGCPADVRGATRITNTILLHDQGMDTWDRGYDENGNFVWGAKTQPYKFRWQNSNPMK